MDGSKESRIAASVRSADVLVAGHPFVDVWAAVKPTALGIGGWPSIPGHALEGRPAAHPRLATGHRDGVARILCSVTSFADLEPAFLGRVEELIDLVTAPGSR